MKPGLELLLLEFGVGAQILGRKPPSAADIEQAMAILDAAPKGVSPMEVAEYFLGIDEVSDSTGSPSSRSGRRRPTR